MASRKIIRVVGDDLVTSKQTRSRRPKDPRETEFNEIFGKRLKDARIRRGLTQPVLAQRLGMTKDQLIKHEMGETTFPPYLLQVLRKALDCSIMDMIDTGY